MGRKGETMRKRVGLLLLITLVVAIVAATSTYAAKNSEQVVFSTPGFFPMTLTGVAPNGSKETPLGFWVWCQAESAAPSNGVYGADKACQGSMYFYFLGHPEHVFGAAFLNNGTGIVEDPPDSGLYTMTVEADDFRCTLKNTSPSPSKALTNTVQVECDFKNKFAAAGHGSAKVTNSVVNVTGP
jgi:hypothetical protein